jgi:HlyD family secretion protein
MTRKKLIIGVIVLVVAAALVYANLAFKRTEGPTVSVEKIAKRNLEAVVSSSGKIRARRTVNITSEVSGKVTQLAVKEGDRVKAGQFLLQIDPRNLRNRLQVSEATLEQQRIALLQARIRIENAKVNLKQAEDDHKRKSDLWKARLNSKQELDAAENTLALRQGELRDAEQALATADQRIRSQSADLESARHDLSRVTIVAPLDGLVTRRNVEEGEAAVVGFTNNPSVVLLTIADMGVIEAEVEVDETDIPSVKVGQATKVTIDALPDQTFTGHVTEVGNSPIQTSATAGRQAINFKVVVTLDGQIPDVRPGFTCTSDITTATRNDTLAVPIQALTVREVTLDEKGNIVRQPAAGGRRTGGAGAVAAAEPKKDAKKTETKKEIEGVFVVRGDKAEFVQVKTGIAGEKYFEVLSGLKDGDTVVTGPFASVRELKDGGVVKVEGQPQR